MYILCVLLTSAVLGAASAYILNGKNRSVGGGFCLGFFLGIIGIIIALCLSDNSYSDSVDIDENYFDKK